MKKSLLLLFMAIVCWIPGWPQERLAHSQSGSGGYAIIKTLVFEHDINNLRFPLILLKDTGMSKKINLYLQHSVVGVKTVRTTGRSLFANHYWTPNRTGIDELDYTIEVNTGKILSIAFDGEFMSAHGTPFREYYQFDIRSGEPITLDQLIKQESKKELEKDIRKKRASLIAAHLEKLKKRRFTAGDRDPITTDDLDEVRKDLNESNENVDLYKFSIRPAGIRFCSDGHLPHVMLDLDIDLDVEYSFKELLPWMDDFGKMLLLNP